MPPVMNGVFADKAGLQREDCRFTQVNLVNSRQTGLIYLVCIRELIECLLISLGEKMIVEWEKRTWEKFKQS